MWALRNETKEKTNEGVELLRNCGNIEPAFNLCRFFVTIFYDNDCLSILTEKVTITMLHGVSTTTSHRCQMSSLLFMLISSTFDNDYMRSSKRHVRLLSLIFFKISFFLWKSAKVIIDLFTGLMQKQLFWSLSVVMGGKYWALWVPCGNHLARILPHNQRCRCNTNNVFFFFLSPYDELSQRFCSVKLDKGRVIKALLLAPW